LNRPTLRALLASAAIVAALALAGCNADDVIPTGRALAPLSDKMLSTLEEKQMDKDSPILVRVFKEEAELEVWKKNRSGEYALLKTYPICRWSGDLGPKKREGDRQAPEGFYTITPGQMNPNSNYYLAFNTGFPNAYDRSHGYTGSELMVHGDCSSRGCYAMTDEQIQEIYALARESFFGGQKAFQFEAFPFHMTALNMAKHRNNPNFAFWKVLKEGYDNFEATHQEPKVAVCEQRYVFDAAAPENSSKPLNFSPKGKCPVYRLDPQIASVVLDYRRSEQVKMANYIAQNVATVPMHPGQDGGMNPVFATKLASHDVYDNSGHTYQVAGNSVAPGALPHVANPPGSLSLKPKPKEAPAASPPVQEASADEQVAAAPPPQPEPAQPKTMASLLGGMFSNNSNNSQAQAAPPVATAPEAEEDAAPALRGTKTELAAKPKHAAPVNIATAPVALHPAAAKPKAVAHATPTPAPMPTVKEAKKKPAPPAAEIRTAFSAPPPPSNNLLAGAQPVVPAGTFDQRWSALR